MPNGNVVLERELWRDFFAVNTVRDSLIRNSQVTNDIRRAIEDMRVHVTDIGTLVQFNPVDLGSLQQSTTDTTDLGLSSIASPTLPPLSATLKYTGVLNSVANIQLKQQLDQRSAYIDSPGDFVRITQRGMQSVNLAGRFKETISLRIPAAREEIRILMPKKEVPESSKNNDAGNTKKTGSKSTNDVSKPNPEDGSQYEMTTISEPLYSRVEGITFSVVVARQATHLVHSYHDRYGLDDRKDAAFIVDVTPPQRITLWQWNRPIDLVQTWDIFGKVDAPSRNVFFTRISGEHPSPLYLSNFNSWQRDKFLASIRKYWNDNKDQIVKLGDLEIGLADTENNPTNLLPLKNSR